LPRRSWVRCDKLFTLSESVIVKQYGSLDDKSFNSVKGRICAYLGCK
jgi:mRNA interferase MazF